MLALRLVPPLKFGTRGQRRAQLTQIRNFHLFSKRKINPEVKSLF